MDEVDDALAFVGRVNEPTVLDQGGFERLVEIARLIYMAPDGELRPYLEPEEVAALQVRRGSLTEVERVEIERHVVHTTKFLQEIPWGRRYADVPRIAAAHHEYLNGSGYPDRLPGKDIPVESRIMTIADIFDALTASDRPYKKAVPIERALSIIESEVSAGKCDAELFRVFVQGEVYKRVDLAVPVTTLVRGRAKGMLDAAVAPAAGRRACARRCERSGARRSSTCLVLTDDDEIRTLNRTYRKHDRATDVLSFHLQELAGEGDPAGDGVALGDIVISLETARRRAPGGRLDAEVERLAIHGLCHLFGHDHKKPREAKTMFALERRLRRLKTCGPRSGCRFSRGRRTTSRSGIQHPPRRGWRGTGR